MGCFDPGYFAGNLWQCKTYKSQKSLQLNKNSELVFQWHTSKETENQSSDVWMHLQSVHMQNHKLLSISNNALPCSNTF